MAKGVTELKISWTTVPPKKEGLYLYRDSPNDASWTVVSTLELFGEMEAESFGSDQSERVRDMHGEWSLLREKVR